ncbi:MAG: hypothetical protein HS100_18865 [Anaerolineales bacterium]|nr:hypothetical protein [Anaerolineales bacterium]
MNYTDPSGHICVESDGDSDVGMAGNCSGKSNPNYKGGLMGSPSGWTRGGTSSDADDSDGSSICSSCSYPQNAKGNEFTLFSDIAYYSDIVGAYSSIANLIVADTMMAIIIAGGCSTGAGCVPAIGDALLMDYLITTYSPVGVIENISGGTSAVATILDDFFTSETSYIDFGKDEINIGIGQDSVVAVGNGLGGLVPEANFDAWVSYNQLLYDEGRRSGDIQATTLIRISLPIRLSLRR